METPEKTEGKGDGVRFTRFAAGFEFAGVALVMGLSWAAVRAIDPAAAVIDQAVTALWVMLAIFSVMTMGIVMLLRTSRGTRFIGALFAFALLMGTGSLFAALVGPGASVLAMTIAAFAYYANPPVWLYDAVVIAGVSGIAASMGPPLTPDVVLVFLAVLAVYDVVAVYGTRHMVRLAKVMLRRRVFFAMIVPEAPQSLRVRLDAVGSGKGFLFLGTGDLVLPALLVASVAARYGADKAVPIALGVMLGYAVLDLIFVKGKGRPMPALPPIAAGALLGYAYSFLLQ